MTKYEAVWYLVGSVVLSVGIGGSVGLWVGLSVFGAALVVLAIIGEWDS